MPPRNAERAVGDLPEIDRALGELSRRTARAYGAALVRLVGVAVLTVLLLRSMPGARGAQPVLDAIGAVLILWPLFTALGRLYAWRIALGRAYARAERWQEAARTLTPFLNPRARMLYDAGGEGTYWLASACRATGRVAESQRLYAMVAGDGRGEWGEAARAALSNGGASEKAPRETASIETGRRKGRRR